MRLLPLIFAALATIPLASRMAQAGEGKKEAKAEDKRDKLDGIAKDTLAKLFAASPRAKELYDQAYGHAVFNNVKVSLVLTGGGGSGLAVNHATGEKTYMKMGTGGVNVGLGGQKYQVVFLFETETSFSNFVNKGWEADAGANAVAGKAGANAEATFRNGVAIYQLTEKGLMLQADLSGTKYWKADNLN